MEHYYNVFLGLSLKVQGELTMLSKENSPIKACGTDRLGQEHNQRGGVESFHWKPSLTFFMQALMKWHYWPELEFILKRYHFHSSLLAPCSLITHSFWKKSLTLHSWARTIIVLTLDIYFLRSFSMLETNKSCQQQLNTLVLTSFLQAKTGLHRLSFFHTTWFESKFDVPFRSCARLS